MSTGLAATDEFSAIYAGEDGTERRVPWGWLRAASTLGISVQPAHQRTPTDKAIMERTFEGIASKGGRWEVHDGPYSLTRVWVRNRHHGGWVTAPWTHLSMVSRPFADFTWRHARRIAVQRGVDDANETTLAPKARPEPPRLLSEADWARLDRIEREVYHEA